MFQEYGCWSVTCYKIVGNERLFELSTTDGGRPSQESLSRLFFQHVGPCRRVLALQLDSHQPFVVLFFRFLVVAIIQWLDPMFFRILPLVLLISEICLCLFRERFHGPVKLVHLALQCLVDLCLVPVSFHVGNVEVFPLLLEDSHNSIELLAQTTIVFEETIHVHGSNGCVIQPLFRQERHLVFGKGNAFLGYRW